MVLKLTVACEQYDRVQAIFDGRVRIEGCDVTTVALHAEEAFHRAYNGAEFDVSELSASSYTMATARNDSEYIAVPAFVSKCFRHSAIFIRTDRGIKEPKDLIGKTIGLPEYQMTACLWARGILADEYGVKPKDIKWVTGGLEQAGRKERSRLTVKPGTSVSPIPSDKTLSHLLDKGEIDGMITARVPSCYRRNANVKRLFEDYRPVEVAYFQKTKIFPIMHLIAIKKKLVAENPWLPVSIYKAFLAAKEIAIRELFDPGINFTTLPWVYGEVQTAMSMLGTDYWSYGMEENRAAIETMVRYSYEDGLSQRHLKAEELFHPSTIELSKL